MPFLVAGAIVALHLALRVRWMLLGRFFASEDDAYRLYSAFLIGRGGTIFGKFWLPLHGLALAGLLRLGLSAPWAGLTLGALSTVAGALALADLVASLAPDDARADARWAAVLVVAGSPMALALGHSALSEPLSSALLLAAAAGFARRSRTGSTRALAAGLVALLAATWVRYDAWPIAVTAPLALAASRLRAGYGARAAFFEGVYGAAPLAGPLGWMALQGALYEDPLAFLEETRNTSRWIGSLAVLEHRALALVTWAPVTLVAAIAALWLVPKPSTTRRRALAFAACGAAAVCAQILVGREHDVFRARLAFDAELALWPLAALAFVLLARRPMTLASFGVATAATLVAGALRPADLIDRASPELGARLRRGELDATIGAGVLLVERPRERPPMGWAAAGVLWEHWDRVLWATRDHENRWELVAPLRVRALAVTSDRGLPSALAERGVTAAWLVGEETRAAVLAAWPHARVTWIGSGALVERGD